MLLTLRQVGLLFPGKDFSQTVWYSGSRSRKGCQRRFISANSRGSAVCSVWSLPVICNTSIDTSENSVRTSCSAVFERKKHGIQLHCDNFRTGCQTGPVLPVGFFTS